MGAIGVVEEWGLGPRCLAAKRVTSNIAASVGINVLPSTLPVAIFAPVGMNSKPCAHPHLTARAMGVVEEWRWGPRCLAAERVTSTIAAVVGINVRQMELWSAAASTSPVATFAPVDMNSKPFAHPHMLIGAIGVVGE